MLLIADSGSTKCDWIVVDTNGQRTKASSMGFNPFFHSEDLIASELTSNEILSNLSDKIKQIRFYGAGASSDKRKAIVESALTRVFKNADDILVDHDLMGAAIATAQDDPGISCILGTGSNSCYYDGNTIHEEVPALGYVLGDEGSGAYFGKILLTKYLYHKLPTEFVKDLEAEYGISKEIIFDAVYNKPNPNVYLASFMKFASARKEHPFFKELIYKGLSNFVNIHVWCYDNFREVPVHFVGSIAYYFSDVLKDVAKNYRFTIGNIVKKPIGSLADYHCKKLNYPILD